MRSKQEPNLAPIYHIKVVKGRTETLYSCFEPTITTLPKEGYYAENPHIIDMPPGQKVKIVTETGKTILIPRDGRIVYIMNEKGDTINAYPKKRDREFGLKVGEKG